VSTISPVYNGMTLVSINTLFECRYWSIELRIETIFLNSVVWLHTKLRFGINTQFRGMKILLETPSRNIERHPYVLRRIRPHISKLKFNNIQTIKLKLHLIFNTSIDLVLNTSILCPWISTLSINGNELFFLKN
jgi:hypothetical protein